MSVKCSIAMCQVCHAVTTVNYGGEKSLWKTVKRFFIFFLFYIYSFFMFILGQEISSGALFALRRSHGCRSGRESWLPQVHWQRGGLQVNIAVLKKKMPKTDTLDALNDAMTTILTTNLDN